MSPTTPFPTSVNWLELSRLSLRIPPGTPPFPLGTPFKRHTVDWFAIYGIRPSFFTTVVPTVCTAIHDQSRFSAQFVENNFFGNSSPSRVLGGMNRIDASCTLTRAELELLDGADNVYRGSPGTAPSDTITHWFLFIPVNFTVRAAMVGPGPALGPGTGTGIITRDLSAPISFSYDLGRRLAVRWRYTFSAPAGVDCTPVPVP
jgi:hypothetical protein